MGFIHKLTRKICNKYRGYHDYEDLLSVAFVAAVEAEKRFNPDKGEFSSYIRPRVEGALLKYASNLTVAQHRLLRSVYKFIEEFYEKHAMYPTQETIIKALGTTRDKLHAILTLSEKSAKQVPEEVLEDASIDCNLDMLSEFENVMQAVSRLPKKHRDKINAFLLDPSQSEDSIKEQLRLLRGMLQIEIQN